MAKKFWEIRGYEGYKLKWERLISVGSFSEKRIEQVLQRLACLHLNQDEIISASLPKNARGYAPHLKLHFDTNCIMTTGSGEYYVARVVDGKPT